ncbi:MAG: hypothetical protein AAGM22_16080 [Acidobacteriota bacterium]
MRANTATLGRFIDLYLNTMFPREVGKFYPALPYVTLCILDYGRMASDAIDAGWIAQREFSFFVPLAWYRRDGRRWVFNDWVWLAPFLYVDNEFSLQMGREVYGWEKVHARATPLLDEWLTSTPQVGASVLNVSSHVWPATYESRRQELRQILTIRRKASPSILQVPPNPRQAWNPLAAGSNAVVAGASLAMATLEGVVRWPLAGFQAPAGMKNDLEQLRLLLTHGWDFLRGTPYVDIVSLKQLRAPSRPELASYQAIIRSRMETIEVNRMGALGEDFLLTGDASGGFRLSLHSYPSLQIVETLGIETEQSYDAGDHRVHWVEPIAPFWLDMHLRYNRGIPLAWRTRSGEGGPKHRYGARGREVRSAGVGSARRGRRVPQASAGDPRTFQEASGESPRFAAPTEPPRYNSTLERSDPTPLGPFRFPSSTVRVLPLLADRLKLFKFVAAYSAAPWSTDSLLEDLFSDDPARGTAGKDWDDLVDEFGSQHKVALQEFGCFEPMGDYVYLCIFNHDSVHSEQNDVGAWAKTSVEFAIPVRFYREDESGAEGQDSDSPFRSVGLLTPYVFTDSSLSARTRRELFGLMVQQATIKSGETGWLEKYSPDLERQTLMILESYLAAGPGQKNTSHRLLEISSGSPMAATDTARWRVVARDWFRKLSFATAYKLNTAAGGAEEAKRFERARSLAVDLLVGEEALNFFALRQLRAAEDPTKACFQSMSRFERRLLEVKEIEEIEEPLHVEIERFANLPIAESLGLVPKAYGGGGSGSSQIFQPVRPFRMKVHLTEKPCGDVHWASRGVSSSSGARRRWTGFFRPSEAPYAKVKDMSLKTRMGVGQWIDDKPQAPLRQDLHRARREYPQDSPKDKMSIAEAQDAVASVDPQLVLENILSREWLKWRDPRWKRGLQKPDFCIPHHTIGSPEIRRDLGMEDPSGWSTLKPEQCRDLPFSICIPEDGRSFDLVPWSAAGTGNQEGCAGQEERSPPSGEQAAENQEETTGEAHRDAPRD